jgi:hypothetical protein
MFPQTFHRLYYGKSKYSILRTIYCRKFQCTAQSQILCTGLSPLHKLISGKIRPWVVNASIDMHKKSLKIWGHKGYFDVSSQNNPQ